MKLRHGHSQKQLEEFFGSQDLLSEEQGLESKGSGKAETEKAETFKKETEKASKSDGSLLNSSRSTLTQKQLSSPSRVTEQAESSSKSVNLSDKPTMKGRLLFRGLCFYFVPTNRTKLQKLRSLKYQEFGAEIVRKYPSPNVTHLIIDKSWGSKDVLDYLKVPGIPNNIQPVLESWPINCIETGKVSKIIPPIYKLDLPRSDDDNLQDPSPSKLPVAKRTRSQSSDNSNEEPSSRRPQTQSDENNESSLPAQVLSAQLTPPKAEYDELEQFIDHSKLQDIVEGYISDAEPEEEEMKSNKAGEWMKDYLLQLNTFKAEGHPNPNQRVMEIFDLMQQYYLQIGDEWRSTAYRRAISTLKRQKVKIETAKEAQKLPGFGKRLSKKLEEIVQTNGLRRLDEANKDPAAIVLSRLGKIFGVGTVTARAWYNEGARSLEDVVKRQDLTAAQKIGIQHYEDFNERMPRTEVDKHYQIICDTLKEIDDKAEAYCMGSYRRQQPDCGDIDIILTKPDVPVEAVEKILGELIFRLYEKKLLKCTLAGGGPIGASVSTPAAQLDSSAFESHKWMGASSLESFGGSSTWRRLDFLVVPWDQRGASLIYFTGNDLFNRSIRLLASKKGMRLNQKGLFRDVLKENGKKLTSGTLIESEDEKKIFQALGLKWRPPEMRNVG